MPRTPRKTKRCSASFSYIGFPIVFPPIVGVAFACSTDLAFGRILMCFLGLPAPNSKRNGDRLIPQQNLKKKTIKQIFVDKTMVDIGRCHRVW